MVAAQVGGADRTPSEGPDQATPSLAVGADEGRLRPAGVRRSRRGIRRRASRRRPRARPRPRAGLALRSAGPADGGAEVEQGLVPGPALALRHGRVGQRLDLPGPQRAARPAGPGPSDVGVDDGHVGLEGERHDRPGRVRPDAGQVLQIGDRPREDPAEVPLDRSRRGVQPDGAAVVAETAPQPEQVAGGRRRALGRGREPLHHLEEAGDDPRHLRLLEHGLGHEDGPRVAGPTPRQVAPPGLAPLQQRAPIVLVHAPLRDQLQAACSS